MQSSVFGMASRASVLAPLFGMFTFLKSSAVFSSLPPLERGAPRAARQPACSRIARRPHSHFSPGWPISIVPVPAPVVLPQIFVDRPNQIAVALLRRPKEEGCCAAAGRSGQPLRPSRLLLPHPRPLLSRTDLRTRPRSRSVAREWRTRRFGASQHRLHGRDCAVGSGSRGGCDVGYGSSDHERRQNGEARDAGEALGPWAARAARDRGAGLRPRGPGKALSGV